MNIRLRAVHAVLCLAGGHQTGRLALVLLLAATLPSQAALFTKAPNATALNDPNSWVGSSAVPGSGDTALWSTAVTAAIAPALGGDLSVAGITFVNPGGGSHSIANTVGKTLTIGASGIDMSAATKSFNIMCNVALGANQAMNVGGSSTFALTIGSSTTLQTLTGSSKITKSGIGILRFMGDASGYSGELELNGGFVDGNSTGLGAMTGNITFIGNSTLKPFSGTLTLGSGRTVTINSGITATLSPNNLDTLVIDGLVTGLGNVSVATAGGRLVLNGNNDYSGNTTVSAGTFDATDAMGLPDGAGSGNLTLSGGIWQSGGNITRTLGTGAGQVQLTVAGAGFSARGGPVNVSLDGGAALTWGSGSFFAVATTAMGLMTASADNVLDFQNAINLGATARTFAVADNTSSTADYAILSGNLSGSATLAKTGAGTLRLTGGTQSNSGAITISAGAIELNDDDRLCANPGSFTAAQLTLNGGTLKVYGSFNWNGNRGITLGASDGILLVDSGQTLTMSQPIAGGTAANLLYIRGAGTVTLGAANLLADAGGILVDTGGTLDLGGNSETVGAVTLGTTGGTSGTINNGTLTSSVTGFTVNQGTVGAILAGTMGLTKQGVGTVTLGANNTFSGTLTVNNGTLQIAYLDNSHNGSGAIALGAAALLGILEYNGAGAVSTTRGLSLAGTAGGATLVASGADSSATLSIGGTFTPAAIAKTLTLSGENTGANTLGCLVANGANNVALSKTGGGTWIINQVNTHSGATTISGGILRMGAADVLSNTSALNVNGGTLDTAGYADSSVDLTLTTGSITGNGTLTGNTDFATVAGDCSAVLAGSVGLDKSGAGVVTLTGANTYSGTLTVSNGTLQVASLDDTHNGTGTINLGTGATSGDHILEYTGSANISLSRAIGLAGTGNGNTFKVSGSGTVNLTGGAISVGGTAGAGRLLVLDSSTGNDHVLSGLLDENPAFISLTKDGTDRWILSGNNTEPRGTFNVSAGILRISNDNALGTAGTYGSGSTIVADGASLELAGVTTPEVIRLNGDGMGGVGALRAVSGVNACSAAITLDTSARMQVESGATLTLNGTVSFASKTLTFTGAGDVTAAAVLAGTGTGGTVVMSGTGVLALNNLNTYSGPTTVNAGGTIRLGHAVGLGTTSSATTVNAGGVLDLYGFAVGAEPVTLNGTGIASGGALVNTSGTAASLTGGITLGSNSSVGGSGSLTLTGVVSDSGLNYDLAKVGLGTLTLGGASANTYGGLTTISAGTVALGHAAGLGATTAGTLVAGGAVLDLNGKTVGAESLTINGAGTGAGALINTSGSASLSAGITLGSASTIGGTSPMTLSGQITGAFALTKDGANTVTLSSSSANDYTGDTTITAGTLKLGVANAIPNGGSAGNVSVAGTLDLSGDSETINGLSGAGTVDNSMVGGPYTLTVGDNNQSSVFSGTITDTSGTLALTKTGSGTLTLSGGANAYSGATTVDEGRLRVTGALTGTGAVAVNSDGILDGDGSVAGLITVNDKGIIAAGVNAVGTLTASGGLTLQSGSTNIVEFGTGNDQIDASGATVTINGGTVLLYVEGTTTPFTGTGSRNLIKYYNGVSGTLVGDPTTLTVGNPQPGYSYQFGSDGTWVTVSIGGSETWNGQDADDNNWASGDNWLDDSAPLENATLVFAGTARLYNTNNLTANWDFGGITFDATSGRFVIFGNAIDLGGNIANNDGDEQTFAVDLRLVGADRTLAATAGNLVFSNVISELSGPLGILKTGGNTVTYAANNTYSGDTTISAGTLRVGTGGTAGDVAGNIVNDGVLVFNRSDAYEYDGNISGSGTVTKENNNALTLSGANTVGGGVTLSAGALNLKSTTALGAGSGTFTIAGGTTIDNTTVGSLTLVNNNPQQWNGDFTFAGSQALDMGSGAVTMSATRTVTVSASTLTVGAIAGPSSGLIKNGAGTLTLRGANTYEGATTIDAGTLRLTASGVLPNGASAGNVTVTDTTDGDTLDLNGISDTINGLLGAGTVDNTAGGVVTLTVGDNNAGGTFSGIIQDTGGALALTKTGSGTLTLSGANDYAGLTTVNAGGVLRVAHSTGLGAVTLGTTVASGAALEINGGTLVIGAEAMSIAGTGIGGNGALRNLAGDNSIAGLITLMGTTRIQVEAGSSLTLDVAAGSAISATAQNLTLAGEGTLTINDPIATTTGTLTKEGSGTNVLSGANSYTGDTFINAGALRARNATALGTIAGNTIVAGGTALEMDNAITIALGEDLSLTGTGIGNSGALRNVGGLNAYLGVITLGAGGARINADAGGLRFDGLVTALGSDLTVGGAGLVTNTTAITGGGGLTKDGSGTFTLAAVATYTGPTLVDEGILRCGVANGLANGLLTIDGATLDMAFAEANAGTVTLLSGFITGGGLLTAANFVFESGTNSAPLSTGGALLKQTAGTVVHSNSLAGVGPVVVNGGTLTLGNTLSLGPTASAKLYFGAGSNGKVQLNNQSVIITNLAGDATATIENGGATTPSTLTINNAIANTFDGLLQDGGSQPLALTKAVAGVLTLSGANTYSGLTTLTLGTLQLGAAGVIPDGVGKGNVSMAAGAVLDLNGFGETVNGITGNAAGIVTNSSGTAILTVGNGDADGLTTSGFGDAVGASLSLVKMGTGIQTNNGIMRMSGGVTVNGGVLKLGAVNQYVGDTVINNSGTFRVGVAEALPHGSDRGNVIVNTGGTLDMGGVADTINGLSGSGIVTNLGPAGTDILTVGGGNASSTFSGSIRDGVALLELNKTGSGTLELSGANTHAGQTEVLVNGGVLRIAHADALGQVGAALTDTLIGNGGALELVGDITVAAEKITITGTGIANDGVIRNISGVNTLTGLITMGGGAGVSHRINADAGSALIIDVPGGEAIDGTSQVGVFGGAGNITIEDPLGWTTGAMIKDGTGTLRLNGTTTTLSTGTVTVEGGTLLINGALSGTTAGLVVNNGATLGGYGTAGGVNGRAVTNLLGSVMAPGDPLVASGIGTLTVEQWELQAGCSNVFEITDETVRDQVIVQNSNGLKIDGGSFYLFQPGTTTMFDADGNYDLIQYSGTLQGAGETTLSVANENPLKTYAFELSGGWVRLKISSAAAWNGGDLDDNLWSSSANWGGSVPSAGSELRFDTNNRRSNTNDLGVLQFAGITFNATAGAFELDGDAINLTANVVNSSPSAQRIDLDLVLDGNSRTLDAAAGAITVNGAIGQTGGTYGVDKTGASLVTLGGPNTFGGTVSIQQGALRAANADALGDTVGTTIVANNTALQLAGDITTAAEALSLSGTGVSSDGALHNVSGANTYRGVITLAANSQINADSGSRLTLDVSTASAILGLGLEATFGGDGDITVVDGVNTSVGGSVVKVGNGTTTFLAANDYRGFTAISAGALRIGNATGLGTVTLVPGTEVLSGAALELTNTVLVSEVLTLTGTGVANGGALRNVGNNNEVAGDITLGAGGARINSDSGILTFRKVTTAFGNDLIVGGAGDTISSTGGIQGGGRLIKDGSGTLTLNLAGTYTGDTIITNGTLKIGVANTIPNGVTAGNVYVYPGATLDVTTADTINGLWGNGRIDNASVTARALAVGDNTASSTFSGTLTNSGSTISLQLTKVGNGTLTLLGTNWYGGVTTVSGGTLQIGDGNDYGTLGVGDVTVNSPGVLVFNRSDDISHGSATVEIGGTGSVTKEGAGNLSLNGVNTFSGTLTINAGSVTNNSGLTERLANTMDLTVNNGAIFDINALNETVDVVTLNDGSLLSAGGAGGGNFYATSVTAYSGTIAVKPFERTGTTFTKLGPGTVTLIRTGNGYTGKTFVYEGTLSIVRLDNLSAVSSSLGAPTTALNGTIDLGSGANSATLKFAASGEGASMSNRKIDLTGTTGTVSIDASGAALTETLSLTSDFAASGAGAKTLVLTGSNAGTNTITGAIVDGSGTTGLTKTGAGKWILGGVNAYTGATAVDAGTLVVNGSLAAGSTVAVNSGGTLMGTGTLNGAVSVNAGGTLAPGASIGDLTVGSLDLNTGSTNTFEFTWGDNDTIVVNNAGGLNIDGGGVYVYEVGGTSQWTNNGIYNVIQYTGALGGDEQNLTVLNPYGGKSYDFVADGTWVKLIISDGAPLVGIGNAGVIEGNSGTTTMVFTVTMHETSASLVSGEFSTFDGTAKTAFNDYAYTAGTFQIAIGALTTQVTVQVTGETAYEANESFTVVISNLVNASVNFAAYAGTGTITDDDTQETQIYVNAAAAGGLNNGWNWGDAYTQLWHAVATESGGDTFWVAAGTYTNANGSTPITLEANDVLYGGFAGNETAVGQRSWTNSTATITGDANGDNVSDMAGTCPLMTSSGVESSYATVDGFTFRYGKWDVGSKYGGAISRPTAGAAFAIKHCTFRDNVATYGGAVGIASGTTSTIENSIFFNNSCSGGSYGGAIFQRRGANSTAILNCTFYGNTSSGGNAEDVWRHVSATMTIQNSILWSSVSSLDIVDQPTVTYSDVRQTSGTYPGTGNLNSDPLFVNAAGGDFRLQAGSPALDINGMTGYPANDYAGLTRPQGTYADMGAYEKAVLPQSTITVSGSPEHNYDITLTADIAYARTTPFGPETFDHGAVSLSTAMLTNETSDARLRFNGWNDGLSAFNSNPLVFTLSMNTNFTLLYAQQYRASGSGSGGTVTMDPLDGWTNAGSVVEFTQVPNPFFSFDHWEDDLGTDLGMAEPLLVTLTAPTNIVAIYNASGESVTVQTSPVGLNFNADGAEYTNIHVFSWGDPSTHYLYATNPQPASATEQKRVNRWNDPINGDTPATNLSFGVGGPGPYTITVYFDTYLKLTTSAVNGTVTNLPVSADGFYLSGAVVDLYATPAAGYAFDSWSGDASGSANPLTITMNAAKSITATFKKVFHVKPVASGAANGSTWADACTLAYATANDASGDQIWLAGGTYRPGSIVTNYTLGAGVSLYGGFAGTEATRAERVNPTLNPSILDGDVNNNDLYELGTDSSNLVTIAGANTLVDGITFTGVVRNDSHSTGGGAIRIASAGPITIRGCTFTANKGDYGVCMVSYPARAGAEGNLVVENCLFYDNLINDNGSPVMYMYDDFNLYLRNCTFYGNEGGEGSIQMRGGCDLRLENTILFELACGFDDGTVSGTPVASGLKLNGGSLVYSRNTCARDEWPTAFTANNYNNVYRNEGIGESPDFVSVALDDYRLQDASSCKDAGDNAYAAATDIRGKTRPSGIVDIGAYEMATFVNANLTASPAAGQTVTVAGVTQATPHTFPVEGEVTMSTTSPQTSGATRYVFNNWDNGVGGTPTGNPYTFTATHATNWTAVYLVQYQCTANMSPATGAGSVTTNPADGWVTSGSTVTFTAAPTAPFGFSHWTNTVAQSGSAANPWTFTVTAPTNLTAVFSCAGSSVTVATVPAGLKATVEGAAVTTPQTFCWTAASAKSLYVTNPQPVSAGSEYRFAAWSDTAGQSSVATNWGGTYTVPGVDATATATFARYHKLTTTISGSGSLTTNAASADGYYAENASVQLTAIPLGSGTVFAGWSGDASGTDNPLTVSMTAAKTITATFQRAWLVKPASSGLADGSSWANACTLTYALSQTAGEIWVAAGTYTPAAQASSFTLKANMPMYGGFAGTETLRSERNWTNNVTILSGELGNPADPADNVNRIVIGVADGTLDGFRIQKAYSSANNHAAVSVVSVGPMTIRHCTFYANVAAAGAAGGNNASSVYYSYASGSAAFTLDSCSFIGNVSSDTHDGAVVLTGAQNEYATVKNCIFTGNVGSGGSCGAAIATAAGDSSGPLIVNSTFASNTGGYQITLGAAGSSTVGSARIRNCIFDGGSAIQSVRIRYGSTQLRYQNLCVEQYVSPPPGNVDTSFYSPNNTPPTPIDDGGGTTSFVGDPKFIDALGGDLAAGTLDDNLRVYSNGAGIDKGTSTDAPAYDYDGSVRPLNGLYDMGAYEGGVAPPTLTIFRFK
ncbi:MAG: autotransporter-associated beta strand repeat-containing protein [Lentisphaerae bacterium]|nr:autotransporter-associated beta strand repeat-containing protein [Lentisphaerota bacterium]